MSINVTLPLKVLQVSSGWSKTVFSAGMYYPGQKKRTIPEIRGEKNAVPSSDIMLDDARPAQGKRRGLSRGWPSPALIVRYQAWSQDRTVFFSPQISGMVLFFFVQGSRMESITSQRHYLIAFFFSIQLYDKINSKIKGKTNSASLNVLFQTVFVDRELSLMCLRK